MSACDCSGDKLLPVDQAIAELLNRAPAAPPVERVMLEHALGRVLARDIYSTLDLPTWDNSAMDGYALRAKDLAKDGGYLPLAGRVAAGQAILEPLAAGHTVRIFTGAQLPSGADTVVPQERCRVESTGVWFPAVQPGDHVRLQGEELRRGQALLTAGQRLRPQEIGLLASIGLAQVPVYRRLRVCLLSSGAELREPGEALAAGQIYNSNRYSIGAVLRGLGCEVNNSMVMADDLSASRDALSMAAAEYDVIITSGGVSVGEEDHLKQAITELGSLHLWRLAIQPGKPLAFGEIAGKPWIGLPGNPAAALITALVVARPFLLKAQGVSNVLPTALTLPADFDWPKKNIRRQYLRASLKNNEQGQLSVQLHTQQSSSMLTAACWANGLAVVECEHTLRRGDNVLYLPFGDLMH